MGLGERENSIMYLEVAECSFESCKASLHLQSPKQSVCVCVLVGGGWAWEEVIIFALLCFYPVCFELCLDLRERERKEFDIELGCVWTVHSLGKGNLA